MVTKLIENSLLELKKISSEENVAKNNLQESRLIFPKYCVGQHAGTKRVSEQEARFLFIRELEKQQQHSFYYSIETPTEQAYCFSGNDGGVYPRIDKKGQSARFDVCLYEFKDEQYQRINCIEFKNGNADTYTKDFLKLIHDANRTNITTNYFINIIERDDLNKRNTLKSIIEKYDTAVRHVVSLGYQNNNCSLLKIYLFNIKDGKLITFNTVSIRDNTKRYLLEISDSKQLK